MVTYHLWHKTYVLLYMYTHLFVTYTRSVWKKFNPCWYNENSSCDIDVTCKQGERTGMRMHEQWQLHCAGQWGWQMPLTEHVYCVAIAFKIIEGVEQWISSNFVLSLSIPLQKLLRWPRKLQLRATGNCQLHHDDMLAHASCLMQRFLVNSQITQVTQPPYSPDLGPCDFSLFSKLKSPLKGKRFQTANEIRENKTMQLIVIGRNCAKS